MSFVNTIAHRISNFNRNRKYYFFQKAIKPLPSDKILDVGYSDKEYSATDNFLEKNYPYGQNITALGIEEPKEFSLRYPQVKVVQYNGSIFPFGDKKFDIGWSNAVIEHVGNYESQLLFVKELHRTCKRFFFTTPNRHFPVEVHTRIPLLHFLPKKIFDSILMTVGKKWATGNYMNLLSKKKIKKLLMDAGIKKYMIVGNKFLFFTLDFIIIVHEND